MPARILPNIANLEKYIMGYRNLVTKPQYNHLKKVIPAIAEGVSCFASLARRTGTPERTWWHLFHESFFDENKLLAQSAKVMDNHTPTRSTSSSFVILDFTSTFKTGEHFEWSDWLWNEDTDLPDKKGHEQVLALEYNPDKDYRKCLGIRRFYHEDALLKTEYWRDDFEKKPICASRLLTQVKPLTKAKEVLVDGEFINATLVRRFEQKEFSWTGRIKKSLKATYQGRTAQLQELLSMLKKDHRWENVSYLNEGIQAFAVKVKISSLKNRTVQVAVCKNKSGNIAFIGTSNLSRTVKDICKIYGYRWEIEVFFKDIKGNLSFGDYRMRSVAANYRWQVFTLITANLLELVRKTKVERMMGVYVWFAQAVNKLYSTVRITLGMTIDVICDLRNGGKELILALKSILALNRAKYYLYNGVNLARL